MTVAYLFFGIYCVIMFVIMGLWTMDAFATYKRLKMRWEQEEAIVNWMREEAARKVLGEK